MSWEPDPLTRRAVLRGAAVAGATALVRPSAGVARSEDAASVFSRYVGSLGGAAETAPIAAARAFTLVGVQWSGSAAPQIELRTRSSTAGASVDSGWSPWVGASVRGHEPDHAAGAAVDGHFGEPIWTGPADMVQLRSDTALEGVRLHFVATPTPSGAEADAARAWPLAQPILDAGPAQPPIIARTAWARGHAPPRHLPEYGTVKLAFVHHSESPNGYGPGQVPSILFSIFAYHRYVRGYFDIAYNLAVDAFGRIWEGRAGGIDQAVIGAHAGGYNAESTGIVVLGSFMSVAPPAAAITALERLLAWKLSLHGIPTLGRVSVRVSPDAASYTAFAPGAHVSLPRVAGHRDGDQTSCPGNALYARLPGMRPRVAELAGTASHLSIAAPVPAHPPGTAVTVTGRLTDVGTGAALPNVPLEIQQVAPHGGETTIATLTTAADGSWSYTATLALTTMLRALRRAAPASASDIVILAVAPVLSLNVDSTAPLTVSGTVTPGAPHVTIDLYRAGPRGRRQFVSAKHLAAPGGTFQTRIKRPARGHYVLIARTPASARYAAAASPAVPLDI